jgi:hypothetical protein
MNIGARQQQPALSPIKLVAVRPIQTLYFKGFLDGFLYVCTLTVIGEKLPTLYTSIAPLHQIRAPPVKIL